VNYLLLEAEVINDIAGIVESLNQDRG